jgi:hypothetical protein
MTDINGVDIVEGDKLEIAGRTYVLDIDHSLAGDFAVWSDEGSFLRIYATPNFDGMKGVPVQIDYDSYNIAGDCYEGEIGSYEHYKQIVKDISERHLTDLPKCDCASNKDAQKREPIEMKGWDLYLCGYCTGTLEKGNIGNCGQCVGIINENQNVPKKEEVVEELSQTVDRYFEEMSQKLGLKSGDIAPEQSFAIDEAVEKLADVVIKWAEQNQELQKDSEHPTSDDDK